MTGVPYVKGGDQYFQPASVVLLATYTYENTRLLLLSPSAAYRTACPTTTGRSASTTCPTTSPA